MTEGGTSGDPDSDRSGEQRRLVAWARELRTAHDRLRAALRATREAAEDGAAAQTASRDLLLFCHGFCGALTAHHEGEDRTLFPAIAAAHPDLGGTLARLQDDHTAIASLLSGLQAALDRSASPSELERHVEGVAAIMESHFRYEERVLLGVLETLALDADPREVLGPL